LLSILLTGLFSTLKNLPKADQHMREKKAQIHEINFVQMRIEQLLHKSLTENESDFLFEFLSKKKQLSFISNLGIDRDPDFSGPVKAVVFLDKENNFKVDYFPIEKTEKKRTEILLKNTEYLDFYFYDIHKKKWLKNSLAKQNILPKMLKIILKKNAQEIEFAYIFPEKEPFKL
jgi:hypothetical protein